jgi:dienelactone hydrolase
VDGTVKRRAFFFSPLIGSALAQRGLPKREFGYVDWSWERWREITHSQRPQLATEQARKAELIELAPSERASWDGRRASFVDVLSVFLGKAAPAPRSIYADPVARTSEDGYTRHSVRIHAGPGVIIPAYVLVPNGLRSRVPAVLCPHQTIQAGKNSPAGLADKPEMHTAVHLVRRGYVTFTWDALCFGERHDPTTGHYGEAIPFYRQYPAWSLMSKMIWDLSRGIDYLETLEYVDARRIGCVGHSHGGLTTLMGMAIEPRIAVGASNCGYDTFRIDGNIWRWSRATALLPLLGFYTSNPYLTLDFYRAVPDTEVILTPFDMHQMLALIAPRPLLLSTSDDDFVFPNAGWSARKSLAPLERLYEMLGARERLDSFYFTGGHGMPERAASRCYDWLDRWLQV